MDSVNLLRSIEKHGPDSMRRSGANVSIQKVLATIAGTDEGIHTCDLSRVSQNKRRAWDSTTYPPVSPSSSLY